MLSVIAARKSMYSSPIPGFQSNLPLAQPQTTIPNYIDASPPFIVVYYNKSIAVNKVGI
jgi:hypothetical protein